MSNTVPAAATGLPSDRRGFLRQLAGFSIAAPIAAFPVVALAAAPAEDPAFADFARRLDLAEANHSAAAAVRAKALADYNSRLPEVPADLVIDSRYEQRLYQGSLEKDYDLKLIGESGRWRYITETWALRPLVARLDGRTGEGRLARKRLRLAEAYEAEKTALEISTGIGTASGKLDRAVINIYKLADEICKTEARTMAGLAMKARAMTLYAKAAKQPGYDVGRYWGERLVANILAVGGAHG